MPIGKGRFSKISLYVDMFTWKLWGYKSKTAMGKDTVSSLKCISQVFVTPDTFMADGGPHFNCNEVESYCKEIGTHLHIVTAYSPWINGLLERSNGILLDTLKWLCTPNLGEDEYKKMETKDIPKTWPDHLDAAIKHLSDHIIPSLKFSPNELLLGIPTAIPPSENPETITAPTETDILLHLSITEQQCFDGYSASVDHAAKHKAQFNAKVRKHTPKNVVFKKGDLVQVHQTQWHHTLTSMRKMVPMWSIPNHISS